MDSKTAQISLILYRRAQMTWKKLPIRDGLQPNHTNHMLEQKYNIKHVIALKQPRCIGRVFPFALDSE